MITLGKTYRSQWASLQQELNWVKRHIHSLEHTCGFSTDLKGWTYDKGCYFCSYSAAIHFLFFPHCPTNQTSKGNKG